MGKNERTAMLLLRRAPLVVLPLLVFAVWFVAFRPAEFGGPVRYVIIDGSSMEPTLSNDDLVLTRAHDQYEVGDVISFESPIGPVMHRIVGGNAQEGYITEGDNNRGQDPWVITSDQIAGEMWFSLPYGAQLNWLGPIALSLSSAFFGVLAIGYLRNRAHGRSASTA